MKKRIEKKLSLSKETLRNLTERELQGAAGGATFVACSNPCITDDTNCSQSCPSFRC